jgi:GntR family negative regulator for fad regulon and positive regulator of fabA
VKKLKKERSSDVMERKLIQAIVEGVYPIGSALSSERELTAMFHVGRPTVREALQRLERDGWISVRTGQPAVVNNYWKEGNLATLMNIIRHLQEVPDDFIEYLLELRISLLPAYVQDAVAFHHPKVVALLSGVDELADTAEDCAAFDWELQKQLARLSPNPVYLLILNSFNDFYLKMAKKYFSNQSYRKISRQYYDELLIASLKGDYKEAAQLAKTTMEKSLALWKEQTRTKSKS